MNYKSTAVGDNGFNLDINTNTMESNCAVFQPLCKIKPL